MRIDSQVVGISKCSADARAGRHVERILAGKQFHGKTRQIDRKHFVLRGGCNEQYLLAVWQGFDFDIFGSIKHGAAKRSEWRRRRLRSALGHR